MTSDQDTKVVAEPQVQQVQEVVDSTPLVSCNCYLLVMLLVWIRKFVGLVKCFDHQQYNWCIIVICMAIQMFLNKL